jgi:hypothetical protein
VGFSPLDVSAGLFAVLSLDVSAGRLTVLSLDVSAGLFIVVPLDVSAAVVGASVSSGHRGRLASAVGSGKKTFFDFVLVGGNSVVVVVIGFLPAASCVGLTLDVDIVVVTMLAVVLI